MAGITDWSSLAKPEPEWETFVQEQLGGNAPNLGIFPDIASMRAWIRQSKTAMTAEMGPSIGGVKEHDEQVAMRDGPKITCRIYQPENPPSTGSPLAVIYHGGGWCIGGLENEELLCRLLVSKLGMTAVNVDYRLGPEYVYPAAHHDCIDATKWAAENASMLGADSSKGFIIGGVSAGANMAIAVAHQSRDDQSTPALTGCLLIIPPLCDDPFVPEEYRKELNTVEQLQNAPILSRDAMNLFMNNYIPNHEDRGSKLFSPMLWPGGPKGLPPCVFQICGQDPLRDEGLMFERILREQHNIKTKLEVYPGVPHGFHSIAPQLSVSKKFVEDSVQGVKWLLDQK